jgi:hypothetical protein
MSAPSGSSFYESPWFWGYAFSAAVLAGLLLLDDRITARQSQLENQYFARQEHGQSVAPTRERALRQQSEAPLIGLEPFYALAGLGFVVCWGMFLYERFYQLPRGKSDAPISSERTPKAPA